MPITWDNFVGMLFVYHLIMQFIIAPYKGKNNRIEPEGLRIGKKSLSFEKIKRIIYTRSFNRFIIGVQTSWLGYHLGVYDKIKADEVWKDLTKLIPDAKKNKRNITWIHFIMPVLTAFFIIYVYFTGHKPGHYNLKSLTKTHTTQVGNYTISTDSLEVADKLYKDNYLLAWNKKSIIISDILPGKIYPEKSSEFKYGAVEDIPDVDRIEFWNLPYKSTLAKIVMNSVTAETEVVLLDNESYEGVCLWDKVVYIRKKGMKRTLVIQFSKRYEQEEILQIAETLKYIGDDSP
jgi:hypothetical protein